MVSSSVVGKYDHHIELKENVAKKKEWLSSQPMYVYRVLAVIFRSQALFHLQKKGVCHRDISLENLLLDEADRAVLIDTGMSLRVPYTDPCNYGCVADVSAGTSRRLMKAQGQGGKLMYAAPEVVERKDVVDAFAIDMWSAGVVLFVLLVGLAPFKWAHPSDKRYAKISRGGLKDLIAALEIPLSREACDLLQGFFWSDPRRRLTLAEAIEHPWVQGKQFTNVARIEPVQTRQTTNSPETGSRHDQQSRTGCDVLQSPFRPDLGRPRLVTPHL